MVNRNWGGLTPGKSHDAYVLTAESDSAANNTSGKDGAIINARGEGTASTSDGCRSRQQDGGNKDSRRVEIMFNSD